MTVISQCTRRRNLYEGTCQKSYESSQNWGSYNQKETTYFKGPFFQVPAIQIVLPNPVVLIMRIINITRGNFKPKRHLAGRA